MKATVIIKLNFDEIRRRSLILWQAIPPAFYKRQQGYEKALQDYGIKIDEKLIIHCDFNREYAYHATQKILKGKKRPDGIFAVSDRIAVGAMLAVNEAGLSMPEDYCLNWIQQRTHS
jgi:LacI family transcriptional regulator